MSKIKFVIISSTLILVLMFGFYFYFEWQKSRQIEVLPAFTKISVTSKNLTDNSTYQGVEVGYLGPAGYIVLEFDFEKNNDQITQITIKRINTNPKSDKYIDKFEEELKTLSSRKISDLADLNVSGASATSGAFRLAVNSL